MSTNIPSGDEIRLLNAIQLQFSYCSIPIPYCSSFSYCCLFKENIAVIIAVVVMSNLMASFSTTFTLCILVRKHILE